MAAVAERRLPGIRFVPAPPPAGLVLPRMDVAGFVGFAAGGPFDLPVPVEDAEAFRAVFGDDLELALDASGDAIVRSQLGPAVRAFLAGGAGRDWQAVAAANGVEDPRSLAPGQLLDMGAGR